MARIAFIQWMEENTLDTVRLAYRDNDRSLVIYCIKEMAAKHYDLDVQIVRIADTLAYEAALWEGSADLICEHLEYLYEDVPRHGHKATMFLSPVKDGDAAMVVGPNVQTADDLRGKRIAVRTHGRPYSIRMRIRELGLDGQVELVPVSDDDVGRWRQWTKIVDGDCAATFLPCINLPPALAAGLHVLDAPQMDIVGHYHHACATEFARAHDDLMLRYVKATVHALCLMKLRRDEALEVVSREPARLLGLTANRPELERFFDCIAGSLQLRPYPTAEGIANSYEIACAEWPGAKGFNPVTLWDLHWLKQIDDEGFIDELIAHLSA